MEHQGDLGNDVKKLTLEELDTTAGGADFAYAQPILSKTLARFQELIDSGVAPDAARAQVKQEYWTEMLEVTGIRISGPISSVLMTERGWS